MNRETVLNLSAIFGLIAVALIVFLVVAKNTSDRSKPITEEGKNSYSITVPRGAKVTWILGKNKSFAGTITSANISLKGVLPSISVKLEGEKVREVCKKQALGNTGATMERCKILGIDHLVLNFPLELWEIMQDDLQTLKGKKVEIAARVIKKIRARRGGGGGHVGTKNDSNLFVQSLRIAE